MGISLKDALTKAGLTSSEPAKKDQKKDQKNFNRRVLSDETSTNRREVKHSHENHERNSGERRDERRSFRNNDAERSERRPPMSPRGENQDSRAPRSKDSEASSQPRRVTVCGACRNPSPDVEYYAHDRKGLSARWLCAVCADKFMISDEGRLTNQSDLSRKNLFKREYGRTKRYGFVKDLNELNNMSGQNNRGNSHDQEDDHGNRRTPRR